MKRELSFLTLALLALPLAGCGGSGDNDDDGMNPVGANFVAIRDNMLVRGDVNNADRATTTAITGLGAEVDIVGIDFRPANGMVYALGSDSRLYTINPTTSAATAVGAAFEPGLTGGAFGFDFNPQVDKIRIIGDDGQNLRIHPDTGAMFGVDTPITDVDADIVAAAYVDNEAGTPVTTLYAIDANTDSLVMIGGVNSTPSPNTGAVTNVGSLGFEVTSNASLDVAADGTAYLTSGNDIYQINLATGGTTRLSTFDDGVDAFTILD